MKDKSHKVVVPGEEIGVIEEFTPLGLTYESDGRIRSMIVGEVNTNKSERSIEVLGKGLSSPFPLEGYVVEGIVESSSNAGGIVRVYSVNGRLVSSDLTGIIRSHERQEDLYRVGDVIRAKVISLNNRTVWLDISDFQSGVLKTRCSKCGGEVSILPPNNVKCSLCGNIERRKLIGFALQIEHHYEKQRPRQRTDRFLNVRRRTHEHKETRRSFR
ncbi:MAG: exosome complex RNA-binding protein Csl4 [Conexivisphaerales archaeon]